ncbi:GNAT family N-acetyltransferase [Flexibacterium corallicola]|uniref:GNAT family N-acetyltransferase n=1 Tax=Flexibacterium corallicola TaxID=3037259 RepID=UPI00286EBAAB|nr:GNAT family N-acetyltransferase [Pseudovibrio sp. M1P-2-3]
MRDNHSTLLVLKVSGELVGSVMCGEDGHRGWVYYMCTHPNHQGHGYGNKLLAAAEEWLAKRNIWKVQLLVRADNTNALGFYENAGYLDTQSVCLQKKIIPTDDFEV